MVGQLCSTQWRGIEYGEVVRLTSLPVENLLPYQKSYHNIMVISLGLTLSREALGYYKRKRKTMGNLNVLGGLLILLTVLAGIAVPVGFYFAVNLQANIAYSNAFGSDVTMLYDSPSIESVRDQAVILWTKMNQTWDPGGPTAPNHRNIYNSAFPWDRIKENTLFAEDQYFNKLINTRIPSILAQWATIQKGGMIVQGDWLSTALDKLINETKSNGGIDWAIQGAYYLQFYPLSYWSFMYTLVTWTVCSVIGLVGIGLIDHRNY